MLRSFFRFTFPLALYIISISSFAQLRTQQNWWMGTGSRGIQFTQPNDSAVIMTRTLSSISVSGYGNAGGFVASDPASGGLLFYTDGNVVYDANHELMQNGTGLGGNPAGNQPAVGVRLPGSTTMYLVFTNDATPTSGGQIRVTQVDMTLLGNNFDNPSIPAPPLGDVVAGTKAAAVADLTGVSEGMIIIPHSNNTDYWLITQQRGSLTFNASQITSAGIQPAVTYATLAPFPFSAAHLAYHDATATQPATIAVAPEDPFQSIILFDFTASSGAVSYLKIINNSGVATAVAPSAIYDVEFSHNGSYLYASHQDLLIQYDLENSIVAPDTIAVPGMVMSFGLQAAPDSSIYHLYQNGGGQFRVGKITLPNEVADSVDYDPSPFGGINFAAKQFPSFLPKTPITINLDFTVVGNCQNSPISFFPTVDPAADSLNWSFGDSGPGTSSDWAPTYTYTDAGPTFNVTVTAYLNGVATSHSEMVTINPFAVQVSLVQDTTACSCELNFPKIPPPPSTYPNGQPCNPFQLTATVNGSATFQWYGPSGLLAGQTSSKLTSVDSAGYYYLVASSGGCSTYAGVNIKEYGVDDPRANIWHFGNNAGINFNADYIPSTGADPIAGPVVSAEGVATISDRNGQVILSTNGEQVYDRLGNPAPFVAGGLGGSQFSVQSSLIVPFPNDPTMYYIFLTQEVYPQTAVPGYEMRYAIFDLKRGTYGQLVPMDPPANTQYSAVLFTKSTERLTGNARWVIAHEYGNNNFRSYELTATGIGSPVISSVGSVHSQAVMENATGYMKLSGQNVLAVALSTPGVSNVVEIFDFIDSTGVVTNFRQVDLQQSAGQVYGIEFSGSGTKMYASTINPGSIHEFAYDSALGTYISKPALPIMTTPGNVGAIEMGPDGVIYVATDGAGSLGVITPDEDKDQPSTYNATQFGLKAGTTSTLGLPNFIQSIGDALATPTIAVLGNCFGLPTTFTGSGTDNIDTLTWQFGDGSSQSGVNLTQVEHTYSAPGIYTVTLEVANRCKGVVGLLTTTVEIFGTPTILESNITMCNGGTDEQFTTVDPADPDLSTYTILWNTGESTNVITPGAPGSYTVSVTTQELCVVTGDYTVNDARPVVSLGPDRIVCENSGLPTFDAGNTGSTHTWFLNRTDVTDPTDTQHYTFSTTTPGNYELIVHVLNPLNTCEIRDTLFVVVNPAAQFAVGTITPPSACLVADGSFDFTIVSTGSYFYQVLDVLSAGLVSGGNETGPSGSPILVPNLKAGAYHLEVTNQVTGCLDQETVGISDPGAGFTVSIVQDEFCFTDVNDTKVAIHLETTAAIPYQYRILGETSTDIFDSGTGSSAATTPVDVPPARFVGEVTNGAGCVVVSDPPESIKTKEQPVIASAVVDQCGPVSIALTLDLTAPNPNAATITWSSVDLGAAIDPTSQNTLTMTANPASGNYTYSVELVPAGFTNINDPLTECKTFADYPVSFNNTPAPSFTQSNACADNVTLTATPANVPAGQYAYIWERNDVLVPGSDQMFLTTADNGAKYDLSIQNTSTGCPPTAVFTDIVDVLGVFTVDVSNPQPCEGADFTITATPTPSGSGLSYQWYLNGTALSGQTAATLSVTDDKDGLYKVKASRTVGSTVCPAKDSVQVTVAPITLGTLIDFGVICPFLPEGEPGKTVQLKAGEDADFRSVQWYLDGAPQLGTSATFEATQVGLYMVELVNLYGCPSTDQTQLVEECDPRITGPNAFRPSGKNKEFFLIPSFISEEDFEIFIFNRWGEMVFHSNDLAFTWNGGYKNNPGEPLPPGTYSYLVKFKSSYRPERGIEEVRGGVVLLR